MSSLYAQSFGNLQIAMAFGLVAIAMGISKFLKLNMEKDFFIASLRTTLQLIAVGYILRWIFNGESLTVNLLALTVMTLVAAQAATSRLKKKSMKVYTAATAALVGSVWPLGFLSLEVFFHEGAFTQTSFFIPFMGIALGNALSAISLAFVGLERVRNENMLEVETFKALGAGSYEACQRVYRDVLRAALTPNINAMTVVGIVSLPGMMAGQVLGGVDPLVAARFQVLIMFLILLTAMVGCLIALAINHFYFMPHWLVAHDKSWNFKMPTGSRLALSGPSGAGKSRLLKSMTGLDLSSIRDQVFAKSPEMLDQAGTTKIVYLPQKAFFIPGTVEENLRYPWRFKGHHQQSYNDESIRVLISRLGLSEEILRKNATTLSGGEGQLVHLIRCLQFSPEVLFLDEPTSSLDSLRTEVFEVLLREWSARDNHSLVMITHNKEQISRFATGVLVLSDGTLS